MTTTPSAEALAALAAWHEKAAAETHTMNCRQRDEHLELARLARAALETGQDAMEQDAMEADAIDALIEEGWTWDGDQWQRPAKAEPKAQAQAGGAPFNRAEEKAALAFLGADDLRELVLAQKAQIHLLESLSTPSPEARETAEPVALTDEQIAEFGALCVMNRKRNLTSRELLAEYRELNGLAAPPAVEKPAEPVAVVGSGFQLLCLGGESFAEHARKHGIKVGTKLYAAPVSLVAQNPPSVSCNTIYGSPVSDNDLPGMWGRADFTGGATDCAQAEPSTSHDRATANGTAIKMALYHIDKGHPAQARILLAEIIERASHEEKGQG